MRAGLTGTCTALPTVRASAGDIQTTHHHAWLLTAARGTYLSLVCPRRLLLGGSWLSVRACAHVLGLGSAAHRRPSPTCCFCGQTRPTAISKWSLILPTIHKPHLKLLFTTLLQHTVGLSRRRTVVPSKGPFSGVQQVAFFFNGPRLRDSSLCHVATNKNLSSSRISSCAASC